MTKGGGCDKPFSANLKMEPGGSVKVKQEQVDAIQRFPAITSDKDDPPRTKRTCGYCGLDHKIPTVCPAQGKVCSKC